MLVSIFSFVHLHYTMISIYIVEVNLNSV